MQVAGRREDETSMSQRDNKADILCQPCLSEDENIPAESYCSTCEEFICSSCLRVHRKLSVTKHHVIKSKDEMPLTVTPKDPCSDLCDSHKTEIIKFYCSYHNEVGCGDCMVLNHKACSVMLVSNVSSNFDKSKELNQIKITIEQVVQEIMSLKQVIKTNLKDVAEINVTTIRAIKKFRKEINSYLDKAEAELLMEIETLKNKDTSMQKKLQEECDSLEKEIEDIQNKLEANSDKINQLFVSAKQAQKTLKECQTSVERIGCECRIHDFKFEPAEDLKNILKKKTKSLGSVSSQLLRSFREKQFAKSIVDMKMKFVKKIAVSVELEDNCSITGLAMISCDQILLADNGSKCLMIVNVQNNKVVSRYEIQPPTSPFDVVVINADTAAATLPDEGKILFVNTRNGLTETHRFNVKTSCKGIDHKNGILVVSFMEPAAIETLNLKGQVLREFYVSYLLSRPMYVALSFDGNRIFVSDVRNPAVYI